MQTIKQYLKLNYPALDMKLYIDFINDNKYLFINLYIDEDKSFLIIYTLEDIKYIEQAIAMHFDTNDYEINKLVYNHYIITFLF